MDNAAKYGMGVVSQKQLSNNFPSIFTVLSSYFPSPERSYAGLRALDLKKSEKVRDNYLTSTGYGRLDVAGVFEFLAGIGRGG